MNDLTEFPRLETALMIPGPAGCLEAVAQAPEPTITALAIICHPHSLQGGTMNNKVVTTTQKALRDLGMATIRFNFRGVGLSTGEYDQGIGETDDLLAVLAFARQTYPQAKLVLAGFSFGSFVAYRASGFVKTDLLISLAPPVTHFDFNALSLPSMPWIIVQGDQDEVIDPAAVFAWIEQLPTQPTVLKFTEVGHFFHGRLVELRERLTQAIQEQNL